METIENLFILKISEYEDYDAIISCVKENNSQILLRAKGFFKENSRNILKIKEFSFVMVEYFKNTNLDYKNWGLLKTGEIDLEFILNKKQDLDFKLKIQNILLQNQNSYEKNSFNYIREIIKNKNIGIIDDDYLYVYFLIKNLSFLNINPVINKCSSCGTVDLIKTFSLVDNGLICKKCFDEKKHIDIELKLLKDIINIFSIKKATHLLELNISFSNIETIKSILIDFYKNELGYFL